MKRLIAVCTVLLLAVGACTPVFAQTWTLSADVLNASNPNGNWSTGIYLEGGDAVWLCSPVRVWPGTDNLYYYGNEASVDASAIFFNPTETAFVGGTQWLQPGDVALFPACSWAGNRYAPFVRWTATEDITVSIESAFTGHDETTTDVHVLLNGNMNDDDTYSGTHLFDGAIDGNAGCPALSIPQSGTVQLQSYSGTVTLLAGEYIDFVAGYGNGNNAGDMTGLNATITAVPEPGALALLATGLIGLIAYAWRKR